MKKILPLVGLLALMLITGLTGICCGIGNSPSKVARQFCNVVEKGDAKAYSTVMTPRAAQSMVVFGEKAKGMLAAKGGIVSTKETINGNAAVVAITFKDGSEESFNLVKVEGKWKVDIDTNK